MSKALSSPRRIRLLDEKTVNQVAAGEVIESPASVVKELVENSLDAGAKTIQVEIVSGGRNLIRVRDDGCGLRADEALLAFERHATSKIAKLEDIAQIGTMGFRGEALPSIASVAKCSMVTHCEGKSCRVEIHGGRVIKHEATASAPGTVIEVRSLFYNVPVRRNFQKSVGWDTQKVWQVMAALSLANPACSFCLKDEGKEILFTQSHYSEPIEERVRARTEEILGQAFLDGGSYLSLEEDGMQFYGLLADPLKTRPNKLGQYLFLNRRAVVCPFIATVVKRALGTRISSHRYPIFILHMELPPELIDVNVHPQKKEVRLQQEERIERLLMHGIAKLFSTTKEAVSPSLSTPAPIRAAPLQPFRPLPSFKKQEERVEPQEAETAPLPWEESPPEVQDLEKASEPSYQMPIDIQVLGLVGRYALIASSFLRDKLYGETEGLLLVNQMRFWNRIIYDSLSTKDAQEMQRLLLPISLTLSKEESRWLVEHQQSLLSVGIELSALGETTFIVEQLPTYLASVDLASWLKEFTMEGLAGKKKAVSERLVDQLRLSLSRRAARVTKSKRQLTRGDFLHLLDCADWQKDPAGKPIFAFLSESLVEKKLFC